MLFVGFKMVCNVGQRCGYLNAYVRFSTLQRITTEGLVRSRKKISVQQILR